MIDLFDLVVDLVDEGDLGCYGLDALVVGEDAIKDVGDREEEVEDGGDGDEDVGGEDRVAEAENRGSGMGEEEEAL